MQAKPVVIFAYLRVDGVGLSLSKARGGSERISSFDETVGEARAPPLPSLSYQRTAAATTGGRLGLI